MVDKGESLLLFVWKYKPQFALLVSIRLGNGPFFGDRKGQLMSMIGQQRRSTRVPLDVSIEIEGKKGALPFKGIAVTVNLHGALIRTVKPLEVGSTIFLRVPHGGESPARVVHPIAGTPLTYGVELHEPQNIWGIETPPRDWKQNRTEMERSGKKRYVTPQMTKHDSLEDAPEHIRSAALSMLVEHSRFVVTMDERRRYVSVPEEFANLLGYSSNEMIGMTIDDLTPSGTVDIDSVFREFWAIGKREGFWVFVSRDGKRVLVTFRAKRADSGVEAEYVPLLIAA